MFGDSRKNLLGKTEGEHHQNQTQVDLTKLRDDDKWLLPSVESETKDKKSAKKRKKEKKAKKSKKKKKHKSKWSSSSGTSEEEEEWVEKIEPVKVETSSTSTQNKPDIQLPPVRDEWMNLSGLFPCVDVNNKKKLKDEERARDKKDRETIELLGRSDRELNPYWKNGGTGLPPTKDKSVSDGTIMDPKLSLKSSDLPDSRKPFDQEGRKSFQNRERSIDRYERTESRNRIKDKRDSNKNKVSERHARTSRSRSKERYKSDSRREDYMKQRSRNRENNAHHTESGSRQDKYAFKKPDQDDLNVTSTNKYASSTGTKNWRKPEVSKRYAEKEVLESECESASKSKDHFDTNVDDKETQENIITEEEMNKLGAKIVKCEIMGDNELANQLRAKLEKAREARKSALLKPTSDRDETVIILTETDSKTGVTRPLEPRSEHETRGGHRRKKKIDTHEGGQRVRYFADDDKYSIKEMFQKEKGRSTNEDDAMFAKLVSKSMDMDEMFEDKVRFKETDAKEDERDRLQAIKQHKKMSKSLDNCQWCIDSKRMLKHMIVEMGLKVYVSLPPHKSLTTGHCIIAPIHHITCQTQMDEDVWDELQSFKKALTQMFIDQDEDVIFFETSMRLRKFPHMQLECIPMPKEIGEMAPIYFKKALLECETEWAMNKKVIDLNTKDIRRSIPKGLPYFAVNFGMDGGFAHVIEDEEMFPKNFAQEIIGGMLDLDRNLWCKPKQENFDQQRSKVIKFTEMWKKYKFIISNNSD